MTDEALNARSTLTYADGLRHARAIVAAAVDWNPSTARDDLLLRLDLAISVEVEPSSDLCACPFCKSPVILKEEGGLGLFVCRGGPCLGSGLWTGFLLKDRETAIAAWNGQVRPIEDRSGAQKSLKAELTA